MDYKDLQILIKLSSNARMPYRELAESFDMSIVSIHKRIKLMTEESVIDGLKLSINPFFKGGFPVMIHGNIGDQKTKDYEVFLNCDNRNAQFILAGGKKAYILGILHDRSELSEYSEKVRQAFDLREMMVLLDADSALEINKTRKLEFDAEFHLKDIKILAEFQSDPRAPISKVAKTLGYTTKFVTRRMNRLLEQKWIRFKVNFHPGKSPFLLTILHVHFNKEEKLKSLENLLENTPEVTLIQTVHFTNVSDLMLMIITTRDLGGLSNVVNGLESLPEIREIVPNIIYDFREFHSWVDDLNVK